MPPRRQRVYPLDYHEFAVLMTNKIRQMPQDLIRMIWDIYVELLTFMLIDRTNRRYYYRHKNLEDDLDEMDYGDRRYGPGF